ncbi:glutaredoxin-dependent arsenate reductase [Aeromonas veronii]|uniref:glutaredoxin-dependent arsenate reductase n=1 Tax=Aeromonas veronii TaxID=654 RepID=UPI0032ECC612
MTNTNITIYHNPACGTSRNTLELIRNSGVEPTIIHYLETPPSRETLESLIQAMGVPVRDLLRKNVPPYEALGLAEERFSDEELVDAMLSHPLLINRPIVVTPLGTKLCRPSEVVLDILPSPQQGAFTKEDGERVVDAKGHRIK